MSGGRALRICSLLPSATEIVAALGLSDRLVGRSAECDWPPAVSRLPVVTAARIDTSELTSAAIDSAVRAALADGRSLYAVDAELITRLAPDLIFTQDLCEVCARRVRKVGHHGFAGNPARSANGVSRQKTRLRR
jgi:iron complex transport system substrate-binding protein